MRIVFITSNVAWGGSEFLWSETAAELAARGHEVRAYKNRLSAEDGNVAALKARRVRLIELASFPALPNALYSIVMRFVPFLSLGFQVMRLHLSLRLRRRPDLIVLSQGGNHDGWLFALICRRLKLPFVQICHKASDLYWPRDAWLEDVRANYDAALHSFFVSSHNLRLTEEQLGGPIAKASVVRNPFNVPYDSSPLWCEAGDELRIACVGRLYTMEKGQDILLRVLARDEWRRRAVSLTFFGSGEHRRGLEAMVRFLGLRNVSFAGYKDDVVSIWEDHHLLALPSRAEGLPIVLVEAMLCGRPAVATDVGGNGELIEDDVTGFLADAPTEDSFAEALERAWLRRGDLQSIGEAASARVRAAVPARPESAFADALLDLVRRRREAG